MKCFWRQTGCRDHWHWRWRSFLAFICVLEGCVTRDGLGLVGESGDKVHLQGIIFKPGSPSAGVLKSLRSVSGPSGNLASEVHVDASMLQPGVTVKRVKGKREYDSTAKPHINDSKQCRWEVVYFSFYLELFQWQRWWTECWSCCLKVPWNGFEVLHEKWTLIIALSSAADWGGSLSNLGNGKSDKMDVSAKADLQDPFFGGVSNGKVFISWDLWECERAASTRHASS